MKAHVTFTTSEPRIFAHDLEEPYSDDLMDNIMAIKDSLEKSNIIQVVKIEIIITDI